MWPPYSCYPGESLPGLDIKFTSRSTPRPLSVALSITTESWIIQSTWSWPVRNILSCLLVWFCMCDRSMLPDVVDDFAMRHPSYKDLEPLFFSCYAFCSKLAGGLSVGISTMTLQWVHVLSSLVTQAPSSPSHFAFYLQVCWVQCRCMYPWGGSEDGSPCAVLTSSHCSPAYRDGIFTLLPDKWEAIFTAPGSTNRSPVSSDESWMTGHHNENSTTWDSY